MEGEQRVKKNGNWFWEQIGKRPQHLFDCEVMQICAAFMLKLVGRESTEIVEPQVDAAPGA